MSEPSKRPFSKGWMFAAMGIFVASEILIGVVVGEIIVGRYASISLRFFLQGALHLAGYFVGGIVVGVVSPGVRVLEPAVGAFLTVATTLALTLFTPLSFYRFSLGKLLIGGAIAFALAMAGARLGERLTGNKV